MNFSDLGSYDAIVLAVVYLLPSESVDGRL